MRSAVRVVGIGLILFVLWVAIGAVWGLMPIVWSRLTGETIHLGKYGTWIDLSIWALWILAFVSAIWAIRVLVRRTRPTPVTD